MTTLYKLTDKDSCTHGLTQWGEGVSHSAANQDSPTKLCTDSVIHAYASPHLAVLMAPAHVCYHADALLLWLAEGEVVVSDATKVGCRTLTTLHKIAQPLWTTEKRVEFAIRCALQVYSDEVFVRWANAWLDGSDRSKESADAANNVAADVAYAAVDAAYAAAYAANAAAYAATNAAVDAAYAAAYAANNAAYAVAAAADADAHYATWVDRDIARRDFAAIAESIYVSHNPRNERNVHNEQ